MSLQRKRHLFLSLFLLFTIISACSESSKPPQTQQPDTKKAAVVKMDPLVSTKWLSEHLNDPDLVVLDSTVYVKMDEKGITNTSGRAGFDLGHIPSAGFADLKGNLSNSESPLDFVMPPPKQFQDAIGALGIDNNSRVVIYSAENHVWAARLWWMLHWAGLEQVAILDGGLGAWKAEGRPISTEAPTRTAKKFTLTLNPKMIASQKEVFAAINNDQVNIVDAMPAAHYHGQFSMYARPGHIPTATNMPTSDLIDESGNFKSFDELDMMLEGDRSKRVITYCGGGVAASSAAFTLHRLGFSDVSVYMGSLQEWTVNPENPLTVDVP